MAPLDHQSGSLTTWAGFGSFVLGIAALALVAAALYWWRVADVRRKRTAGLGLEAIPTAAFFTAIAFVLSAIGLILRL